MPGAHCKVIVHMECRLIPHKLEEPVNFHSREEKGEDYQRLHPVPESLKPCIEINFSHAASSRFIFFLCCIPHDAVHYDADKRADCDKESNDFNQRFMSRPGR